MKTGSPGRRATTSSYTPRSPSGALCSSALLVGAADHRRPTPLLHAVSLVRQSHLTSATGRTTSWARSWSCDPPALADPWTFASWWRDASTRSRRRLWDAPTSPCKPTSALAPARRVCECKATTDVPRGNTPQACPHCESRDCCGLGRWRLITCGARAERSPRHDGGGVAPAAGVCGLAWCVAYSAARSGFVTPVVPCHALTAAACLGSTAQMAAASLRSCAGHGQPNPCSTARLAPRCCGVTPCSPPPVRCRPCSTSRRRPSVRSPSTTRRPI